MSSLVIIVPARGGSKRLPGKNVRELAGKPLLAHTADTIREARLEAPVLLTTDSEEIAAIGRHLGWSVPFLRPPELASDNSATIDTILHALDWLADNTEVLPDMTMVLQPTSPLRGPECLNQSIKLLQQHLHINSIVGMTELHLSPCHTYVTNDDGSLRALSCERSAPVLYPNGSLYLTRTAALKDQRSLYAEKVMALPIPGLRAVDIDNESDWQIVEAIVERNLLSGAKS